MLKLLLKSLLPKIISPRASGVVLGILTLSCLQAYSSPVDSLIQLLSTQTDTSRLKTLQRITLSSRDPNQSRRYLRILEEEARQANVLYYQGYAKDKMVESYYSDFDNDSIFIVAKSGEDFCRDNKIWNRLFSIQNILVHRYMDEGSYFFAIDKAEKMYREAKEIGIPRYIATAAQALCHLYERIDNRELAIKYNKETISILREDPIIRTILIESYISIINIQEETPAESRQYLDTLSRVLDRYAKDSPNAVENLNHYQYLTALLFAKYYIDINDPDNAKKKLREAEPFASRPTISPFTADVYKDILGRYEENIGNYEKALSILKERRDLYARYGLTHPANNIDLYMGNILLKANRYSEAATKFQDYIKTSDSLKKISFQKQIHELNTIYELDKMELLHEQDAILLSKSKTLNTVLIIVSLLLLCIGLIILYSYRKIRDKNISLYKQIVENKSELRSGGAVKVHNLKESSVDIEDNDKDKDIIDRLEKLVLENTFYIESDVSRKYVADTIGTNEAYLFYALKKYYNMSFGEYITSLRLEYSKDLLLDKNLDTTIEGIALDSGFKSRSNFHKLFKEKYGMSPAEFRNISLSQRD